MLTLQTFMIEEKNFEDAQEAYHAFPGSKKQLQIHLNNYQDTIDQLKEQDLYAIHIDDIRAVDELAHQVELSMKQYHNLKTTLLYKFDQMVLDCRAMNETLTYYSEVLMNDDESLNLQKLINEASVLKDDHHIIPALDKIYDVKERFAYRLKTVMNKWIRIHQEKIDKFSINSMQLGEKTNSILMLTGTE